MVLVQRLAQQGGSLGLELPAATVTQIIHNGDHNQAVACYGLACSRSLVK